MISLESWRAGGSLFDWRGHSMFARADGTGEPLLAVHGFPTASWDWAAIWPRLVEQHRAIAFDMIGFGLSAKPRRFAYSIMAQADLAEAVLAREGVTAYRLLAHDYGVSVAQELLARQKDGTGRARIRSVCLLNGGLFPETHRPRTIQRLLASPVGPVIARFSTYRMFAKNMRAIWGATPPSESELQTLWTLASASGGMAIMPALITYMDDRRRFRERWVRALVEADVPVRLVDGLLDPVSGAHMVARYRELVPNPDVVELPDAGHYPQLEAPEAVATAVLEHFARA
jgi:pimeloyl-ACP methyl ester carboxylesterase